jgi:hypothetical protein
MIGDDVRYRLSSWNASFTSSIQMKGPDFRRSLKNRRACSASLEINQLNAVKQPMCFYTSLMRVGGRIALTVLIFSGLASIPRCKTRKPSSLPTVTLNTHLSGFNFMHVERNLVETGVVDAHSKIPASLRAGNRIGQPPRVVNLPNKAGVEQLFDLFTDEVLPLNGLLLGLMLD